MDGSGLPTVDLPVVRGGGGRGNLGLGFVELEVVGWWRWSGWVGERAGVGEASLGGAEVAVVLWKLAQEREDGGGFVVLLNYLRRCLIFPFEYTCPA
jgi:hypothetical protein